MDTSKKYVEMCEKAGEIQKLWQPNAGDWFLDKSTLPLEIEIFEGWYVLRENGFIQRVGPADNYDFFDKGKIEIWLPRQDQLQEIWFNVKHKNRLDNALTEKINAFIYWLWGDTFKIDYYPDEFSNFDSMEQLWLAFLMSQKFNKVWGGEKWIKIS